jgi:L,D-transpeptidase ErfK/SrfK
MTAILRNNRLPRLTMYLCFGTATALFLGQWHTWVNGPPSAAPAAAHLGTPAQTNASVPAVAPVKGLRLVARLRDRRVYLYHRQRLLASYPIAIGREGWETPTGQFNISHMRRYPVWKHPLTHDVYPPGPENPLGSRWIEFWANSKLQFGLHGTNDENLIGQAVSHGCLRMRNQDVEQLYDQISVGTPFEVQP